MKSKTEYIINHINSINKVTLHRLFLECSLNDGQAEITDEILDSIDFLINSMNENNSSSQLSSVVHYKCKNSLCCELKELFKGTIGSPESFAKTTKLNDRFYNYIINDKKTIWTAKHYFP